MFKKIFMQTLKFVYGMELEETVIDYFFIISSKQTQL